MSKVKISFQIYKFPLNLMNQKMLFPCHVKSFADPGPFFDQINQPAQ